MKSEQPDPAEVPAARVAMTTALLLLLLACQLPLLTDDLAPRFALGSDSSLLEAEATKLAFSNLELPDVIPGAEFQILQCHRLEIEPASTSASGHPHCSFTDIRAPPGRFLTRS